MGNPLVHWEIMVSDAAKAKAFYSEVFDWEITESPMPGYFMVQPGTPPAGGMMVAPEWSPEHTFHVYFGVDDIGATLARVTASGGTTVVPKTEIPGMGWWAMFADPDGVTLGIFQQRPPAS
jgi:predicted enzyme related to lactoylglutathione lyase